MADVHAHVARKLARARRKARQRHDVDARLEYDFTHGARNVLSGLVEKAFQRGVFDKMKVAVAPERACAKFVPHPGVGQRFDVETERAKLPHAVIGNDRFTAHAHGYVRRDK